MKALRKGAAELFGESIKMGVRFGDADSRRSVTVRVGERDAEQLLFGPEDTISGTVHVDSPSGRRIEHQGIRLELIGQIESVLDRTVTEFTSLVRELVRASRVPLPVLLLPPPPSRRPAPRPCADGRVLRRVHRRSRASYWGGPSSPLSLPTSRSREDPPPPRRVARKPSPAPCPAAPEAAAPAPPAPHHHPPRRYESYDGIHMRLRYFLRLTVAKAYGAKAVHEETFRVYTTTPVDESESNNAIKMEARPRVARAPRTQPRQHVPPPIPVARGPGAGFHLSSVTIGPGAGWD